MTEFEALNAGNSEVQEKQWLSRLFAQTGLLAAPGVMGGLVVSQNATADGNVLITAGSCVVQPSMGTGASLLVNDTQKTLNIFTANPMGGLPRNDIVVFDSVTATITVIVGTPNASPTDPTVPNTALALARLRHAASATTIPTAKIDSLITNTYLRGIKPTATIDSRSTDYGLSAGTLSPALLSVVMPAVDAATRCRVVCYVPGFSSTVSGDRVQVFLYNGAGAPCGGGYVNCTLGAGGGGAFVGQIAAPCPTGTVTMKAQRVGGTGVVTVHGVAGWNLEVIPV